ncbi:MAG: hypothetical protein STSR0008_14790 [Ignavibacterium sp.]
MIKKSFVLVLLSFFTLFAQQNEKVVAKVGNYKIYESEFQERFDFSVHPKLLQESDKLAAKQEFLKQLIAEKLLSLQAKELGYDTTEIYNNIMNPLENLFLRDALYSVEVKNKAYYTQAEILEGVERIKKVLTLKFLYSINENEIQSLYEKIKMGESFDSLLALRNELQEQIIPRAITFGTMEKQWEDSIYRLKVGEFTSPLKFEDGYYIIKLIDVVPNPKIENQEMALQDVKNIVETRATYKRYLDYYHQFFSRFKIIADREVFEKLIDAFVPQFKQKYFANIVSTNNSISNTNDKKYFLRGAEVTNIYDKLELEIQNKIFINLNDNPIKVKYFLNQLSHTGFFVSDTSERSIRASLSSFIRKFIEDELLAIEAGKRGLQKNSDVKKYINIWEDYYLSQMLMVTFFDSIKVNDDDINYLIQQNSGNNYPIQLYNIVEVFNDNLQIMETVLNELSQGANLTDLSRKYTKRDSLKEKGGEYGLQPLSKYKELGKIISQMNVGDIYGPIKVDEGYSIIQLKDKRIDTTNFSFNNQDVRDDLTTQLTLNKFEKFVNNYNAKLANKYGVEIYEDVLKDIDNIYLNIVMVRKMGFGGEIFAVPYTEQFSGWYDLWIQNQNLNP